MSGVADTSIDAYRDLDLSACAKKLLSVMRPGITYTDRQLAALCDEERGWVPDRRQHLMMAGLVERTLNKQCAHTGKTVKAHRLTAKQLELV